MPPKQCFIKYSFYVIISGLCGQETKKQTLPTDQHKRFGVDACYPLLVQMLVCPFRVMRKLAETISVSLPGQAVGLALLEVYRQESMADICYHTQRYFQAAQCAGWQVQFLLR